MSTLGRMWGWFAAASVCFALTGCNRSSPAAEPVIVFTTVPPAAESGGERVAPVAGRVTGARQGQKIVLFAKSAVWWVQPFVAEPFTEIKPDSTWSSTIHLGTDYAALLVDAAYQPPATVEALPARGGSVFAVFTTKGSGAYARPPDKTLTFGGYEWEVRQVPSDRGGANDYDTRNAWVDAEKHLHLLLTQRDGRWTSAEVRLKRSLGYGTYVFVVRDTSRLDSAAALGLMTWDDLGADQNHRELDIELSRWGNPAGKNAGYVVQPHFVAANVFRFVEPAGILTHSLRWEPGRAVFKTLRGAGRSESIPLVAQREFTSGVPVPGGETVRMNLLYFRGSQIPPAGDVEAVIESFEYLP
jgi:hypothetical protein